MPRLDLSKECCAWLHWFDFSIMQSLVENEENWIFQLQFLFMYVKLSGMAVGFWK